MTHTVHSGATRCTVQCTGRGALCLAKVHRTDACAERLQEALRGPAHDVSSCTRLLVADGCRGVADVCMLVEADELSAEIPTVMRLKIKRACERSAF